MQYGLNEITIKKIQNIFSSYPQLEKAIIYGSRAKGNYKPASDIDLTLFGETLTFASLQKMERQLDDLLMPYKIDLSIFHQISNPDLIEHIVRAGKVFYESKEGNYPTEGII
ncbi:MAG: nucleotidyltransferase domain-containing protein [Bacteroidota bacterium]